MNSPPIPPNIYELAARTKKAAQLAVAIQQAGGNAESAKMMSWGAWRLAARAAHVKPPSRETRQMVIELLDQAIK